MVEIGKIEGGAEVLGLVIEEVIGKPLPIFGLMLLAYHWYAKKFGKSFGELCIEDIDKALVLARTAEHELRRELESVSALNVGEIENVSHQQRLKRMREELADIILEIRYYEVLREFFVYVEKYENKHVILDKLKKKPEELLVHEKFKAEFGKILGAEKVEEMYDKLLKPDEGLVQRERVYKELIIQTLAGDSEEFANKSTYDEILKALGGKP
ncbi:MAG: hypothetical protein QW115_07395 [Thermoplasmata archaeon]